MNIRRWLGLLAVPFLLVSGAQASDRYDDAGTAQVQIIHNSADPAAAVVEILVNGRSLGEVAFRQATPFLPVPTDEEILVTVKAGSISADFTLPPLTPGNYVAMATGVLDPSAFVGNPMERDIGFTIKVQDKIRTQAMRSFGTYGSDNDDDRGNRYRRSNRVDFLVYHGATDAPGVDVLNADAKWWNRRLINNLAYGDFSRYRSLRPDSYVFDVTPGNDNGTVVASFGIDLSGLGGGAAVVFASGFLNPGQGEDFGLFAALPSGAVVPFTKVERTASLQAIHNAPNAGPVDVYLGDLVKLEDFDFQTATPFVDVPAGVDIDVVIAPPTSFDKSEGIATFTVNLEADENYVAMATGLLGLPEGDPKGFTLAIKKGVRKEARYPWFVDLVAYHGSPDAPEVDVVVQSRRYNWRLFNNLEFGEFSRVRWALAKDVILDITPAQDNRTVVASFEAPLSLLRGGAAVVFASGFLAPGDGEPAFGLLAALPDGTVLPLPAASSSASLDIANERLQPRPIAFTLAQNFPNPVRAANAGTRIAFSLPEGGNVRLSVFDVQGREVSRVLDEPFSAGDHSVAMDTAGMAPGIYFYRIKSGSFSDIKKMAILN